MCVSVAVCKPRKKLCVLLHCICGFEDSRRVQIDRCNPRLQNTCCKKNLGDLVIPWNGELSRDLEEEFGEFWAVRFLCRTDPEVCHSWEKQVSID